MMRAMSGRERPHDPRHDLRWVLVGLVVVGLLVLVFRAVWNTGPERRIRGGEARLQLREYTIEPRNLVMQAGPLVIVGQNTGRLVHSLRVVSDDDKRGNRRARFAISDPPPLRPGESRPLLRTCLGPGDYRIISGQPGEEDLGMVADLRVDGPAPACPPAVGERREEPPQQADEEG